MIHVRIQAHPSRRHLLSSLYAALSPLPVEVSVHASDPPDPWAGYKRCLSDLPDCSHVLILQDDAQPCRNFAEVLPKVARTEPVCLFMGALPSSTASWARKAMKRDERFVALGPSSFMPLVAVLWPKEKAEEFLEWSRRAKTTRADDGNAGRWVRATKQTVWVSVPSLVEHNDFVPSVKGGRDHVPGKEGWRHALFLSQDGSEFL